VNQFNSEVKILKYPEKIDRLFCKDKTLVVTEFDLTNRCNNKCPGCTGSNEDNDSLTWDEIRQIVSDLKALDNKGIILSGGGEPLMHPRFIDTLDLIRQSGMSIGLNSNGYALTREISGIIMKTCKYFRISLDAGTPQMYEKTHGMPPSAFEKVINNIRVAAEVKKETGSATSFGVGFLTGPDTVGDMENFVLAVKASGADFAQFRPFTGDETDVTETILKLKDKHETADFKVVGSMQKYNQMGKPQQRDYTKCMGMFFSTVITANARMYMCLHHRQNKDFLIGDMREGKSLLEIWTSYKKYQLYENADISGCPPFCRNDSFNRTLNLLDADVNHTEFL
jgi:MoaA/NifB/PqqE/SkfB family radical SAM enzyme